MSGMGMAGIVVESPKEESLAGDDQKDSSKTNFCEIQWQKINSGPLDSNKSKAQNKKSEKSSLTNTKEFVRDYKSIDTSSSANLNKFERGYSFGNEIDQKESPTNEEKAKMKIKRNSSMISLKSINQNLKAMLKITRNDTSSSSDAEVGEATKLVRKPLNPPMAPSVRIDDVDIDDTKMLLNYPQSPQRYPSSSASATPAVTPTTSSTSALLQYQEYVPRSASPTPYLSIDVSPRRSSTSDILNKKTPTGSGGEASKKSSQNLHGSGSGNVEVDPNFLTANCSKERRPSTSELLRKARERKGSEGKLGRSVSNGGSLARSSNRNRRLSMAF